MVNLHKKVLASVVIVQKVPAHTRALRHPVQPDTPARAVDVIAADLGVNRSVNLDAGHLGAREQLPDMDVVDDVACDGAEHRAHAPDDARLLAIRNMVVPYHMVTDVFLRPASFRCALDGLDVTLGRIRRRVVPFIAVFAERDPHARRIADIVVLDDPSLAPVGADQADLLCRGRRPGRCRVHHGKAAHGDEIDARLVRVEHRLADVDLDLGLVGIDLAELRPDCGNLFVHLSEPQSEIPCILRVRFSEDQAECLDTAGRLDFCLKRRPCLPITCIWDRTGAQKLPIRCVQTNLYDSAPRCRRRPKLDLTATLSQVYLLIAHPVTLLDPADTFPSLRTRGLLNTVLHRKIVCIDAFGLVRAFTGL